MPCSHCDGDARHARSAETKMAVARAWPPPPPLMLLDLLGLALASRGLAGVWRARRELNSNRA